MRLLVEGPARQFQRVSAELQALNEKARVVSMLPRESYKSHGAALLVPRHPYRGGGQK